MPSYQRYWLQDSFEIRIMVADRVRLDPLWALRFDHRPYWCCYWDIEPGAFLDFDDGPYPLEPGLLHIIPAHIPLSTRAERDVSHFFLEFHADGLTALAAQGPFARPFGLPIESVAGQLARFAAEELAPAGRETSWQDAARPGRPLSPSLLWRMKAMLYEAFCLRLELAGFDGRSLGSQESQGVAAVLPALRLIEHDPAAPHTNAALAAACHLHEDYFIRLFRNAVGETPARYIRSLRIEEAAERLLTTDQSIDQIADELGFTDRAHLTRVFQRLRGCTPALFRRSGGGSTAS